MSTHIKKKRLYETPFLRILIMSTKGGKKKKISGPEFLFLPLREREGKHGNGKKICSLTLVLLKKNFNIYTSIIMLVYDLIIKI